VRRTVSLLALAVLSLAFAPAPKRKLDPTSKEDLKKMQGHWVLTSITFEGGPAACVGAGRMTVSGTRMQEPWLGGKGVTEYTITLNAAKTPKKLDAVLRGEVLRLVYELSGDELRMCYTAGGSKVRPAAVDDSKKGHYLEVWRRHKP